ncbi:MAG: hypothetical protein Q9183_003105, partial [Haloplaca sp. 2 TL-2023]
MDGDGFKGEKDTERKNDTQHPADQFPAPTIAHPPSPSNSSHVSEHSALDAAAHVHPPTPEMDGPDGSMRRRPLLMDHEDVKLAAKADRRNRSRRHRRKVSQGHGEGVHRYDSDDGHGSVYSTPSTSEEVELEHLPSDEVVTEDEEAALTGKDKRKRKRRRTLNTQLDERVAGSLGSSVNGWSHGWSLADRNVIKASLINALLIASWYLFSVSISVYNRWMFGQKTLNFHFPLFTTCMHMAVQFLLASCVLYFVPRLRPRADSLSNPENRPAIHRESSQNKPVMTRMFYFTRIGPCGTATGLDIGLGNMSFRFVTLTFFTMCKSSALAFILIFAFLFHLEQPSWRLVLIIATMTVGVIMMVAGETDFSPLGFFLIISASFFSGFRWALTQILLLRNPATSNPFSSIFFLAPIMFLVLAVIAIPVEGFAALWEGLRIVTAEHGAFFGIFILLFPGVLAFCMTSSEFALLQRTSVVTLSICGIFKEVVTIGTANLVFDDTLTPINVSGLIVTIGSIAAYNYIKITKMRRQAQEEVEQKLDGTRDGEQQPMLRDGEAETAAPAPRIEVNGH